MPAALDPTQLSARTNRRFRAIAEAVVPQSQRMTDADWREAEAIIAGALAARPPGVQRQVALFLRILDVLAMLRRGRRLDRLPIEVRTRFLAAIENAPVLLFRRGFWGVRTLVLMGYYARPAAAAEVGYRAHARGWEARP